VQVDAIHQNKFVQSVANSPLLRSARRAGETFGVLADDVLMSAMKSARKNMIADDQHKD
jgi:hypothetical protein